MRVNQREKEDRESREISDERKTERDWTMRCVLGEGKKGNCSFGDFGERECDSMDV